MALWNASPFCDKRWQKYIMSIRHTDEQNGFSVHWCVGWDWFVPLEMRGNLRFCGRQSIEFGDVAECMTSESPTILIVISLWIGLGSGTKSSDHFQVGIGSG